MSSDQSTRRRVPDPIIVVGTLIIVLMVYLVYITFFEPPYVTDMWSSVVEAYPAGSMECHVDVMDRVRHVSDLLDNSQYVSDAPFEYQTDDLADELALRMVVESERQPSACAAVPP